MDFAKNLLGKYGWKEGDGLGKNNDGINAALKPSYKFDKSGLGHSQADDLNNHWWENVFNNAAMNMDVSESASGEVTMACKSGKSIEITTKNYSLDERADTYYKGQFLRTSTLINASNEVRDAAADDSQVVFESVKLNPFKVVADEDLFKACKGRTAHKGARHGIKMSGKLARIEAQERELLAKMNLTGAILGNTEPAVNETTAEADDWVKVKKRKHSRTDKIAEADRVAEADGIAVTLFTNDYHTASKKKDKKKRRIDAELADALAAVSTTDAIAADHTEAVQQSKTKRSKSKRAESEAQSVADTEPIVDGDGKKSRKRRRCEVPDDALVSETNGNTISKKSKKAKRQESAVPAEASDFLKTPTEEVALTEKQQAKMERKRQRQMRRLATQVGDCMQIDE